MVGNILTAIFAEASIAAYDGTKIAGGWLDRHYIQLAFHLADSIAGLAYSFIMTVSSYPHSIYTTLEPHFVDHHPLGDALYTRTTTACARSC